MKQTIDPEKIAAILKIPWDYGRSIDPETDKEIVHKDYYSFILSGTKEKPEMALGLSQTLDIVYFDTSLFQHNAFTRVFLRNVTKIIYNEEFKKVIIESFTGEYYSILELTWRPEGHLTEKPWIDATLNINLKKQ